MKKFMKLTRKSAQSGQAIVLVALGMVGLLAFAALALDGGQFYNQRRTAQNASDMAALAGLQVYLKDFTSPTMNNALVWQKIVQLAQANSITDTDGDPSNATNTNVEAWWLDINGNIITVSGQQQKIVNDATVKPPAGANGIRVRTYIPYQTFIGGIVGQPQLTAQADGNSHIVWTGKTISGLNNAAVWVGGGDECNNLDNRIAHNYSNTNTAEFYGSLYIDGSLAVGAVNSTKFHGDVTVRGPVGTGQKDGPYTEFGPSYPFTNNNKLLNPAVYQGEVGGNAKGMSPWAMMTNTVNPDGTYTAATPWQLGVSDFLSNYPNSHNLADIATSGEMFKRYWYVYKPLGLAPDNFYHFIQGDNGRNVGDAAREIDALYNSLVLAFNGHNSAIFVVNGDMTVLNDVDSRWDGVTLIVTGKFLSLDNNHTFTTAGPAARNISVLAGADLGQLDTSKRCASDRNNWVFKVDGNHNIFEGIIYVPHGQALFVGNTAGGNAQSAAVVSYSLYLGTGDNNCASNNGSCEAQSWQFSFNANMLTDPYPAITLQH